MYQVLARKYRPKNFHELLGQTHVSTALINGIEQQRLHHAYLFTGTRGVGKTTIARILAKCLNCETGITSEPCGVCSTCVAIDTGRFIDLIEIDAASRTRVEDTRELLDNVPYAPTQGRYKVYLIDEVHMLSTHSFNALLKTLEEPPEHVKFLLATTDPQKLPITIISRCLQFVLRPLPQHQLADYLALILGKEAIDFEPDALWQLASSAKGSVRDALSLTDQAIAFGNGQIGQSTVQQMLGLIDQADVIGLLTAIVQHRSAQVGQVIVQLRQQVVDAKAVFDSLAEILHQLALLQVLPEFDLQLDDRQTQARKQLALLIPADLLQLYYEIVTQSRENMGLANTPLQALEMCILRLMAFRPLAENEFIPPTIGVLANITPQDNEGEQASSTHTPVSVISQPPENPDDLTRNFAKQATTHSPQTWAKNLSDDIASESGENTVAELEENRFEQENFPDFPENRLTESTENNGFIEKKISQDVENLIESVKTPPPLEALALTNIIDTDKIDADKADIAKAPTDKTASITAASENFPLATTDSPLALLIPPSQDLTGAWSPEKWDYWVFQARANKQIDNDELVLAKRGVMVGQIAGHSEFITDVTTKAVNTNFQQLFEKLQQAFVGSEFTCVPYDAAQHGEILQHTPEQMQAKRENFAVTIATQRLVEQPVVQLLLQQHATLSNVTLSTGSLSNDGLSNGNPNANQVSLGNLKPNPNLISG